MSIENNLPLVNTRTFLTFLGKTHRGCCCMKAKYQKKLELTVMCVRKKSSFKIIFPRMSMFLTLSIFLYVEKGKSKGHICFFFFELLVCYVKSFYLYLGQFYVRFDVKHFLEVVSQHSRKHAFSFYERN